MKTMRGAARESAHASPKIARRATAPPDLELTVQYATRSHAIPKPDAFRRWIRAALGADARITVRLVGLAEARGLNRKYRGRDYATNVLTFVLSEKPPYEGDLALCAPVVLREARAQRKTVTSHYAHLTVHGVLHLQGYDHARPSAATRMEKLETRILKELGYPDPYAPLTHHG